MLGFDLRIAKIVWTAFLVALLLFITYSIWSTLLVVIFSIFFSYLVYPLVQLAERYKPSRMPRIGAIAIVFIFVIVIVTIASMLFGTRMAEEAAHLGKQLPELLNSANISERIPLPSFLEPLRARLLSLFDEQLHAGTAQALPLVQRLGMGVMHAATNLIYIVLVPVLSFLLIKDAAKMRVEILSWLSESNGRLWAAIADDLDVLLAGYVRALLLLSIATFASYSIVFAAFGVP